MRINNSGTGTSNTNGSFVLHQVIGVVIKRLLFNGRLLQRLLTHGGNKVVENSVSIKR